MLKAFTLVGISFMMSASAFAMSAEERGMEIAVEMDKRDTGWTDRTVDMEMILRNAAGKENVRKMRNFQLEVTGDGDKSLTIFDEPHDVKKTAFLSFTHSKVPDDQWLYLPALKRVKRVSSANKSGPFMGSEFAYEDISSQEVDKYTYKYLRDEPCGENSECFVVEYYPEYENSGYTRQVQWIDKEIYQARKIEYYDRKDDLLKVLTLTGYQQYLDQYWRADRMDMENKQTGKSTTMLWNNNEFKTGLSENDFNKNALKRMR
ncbi:outer membrane lipoprotein-sorting protein [Alteromonas sp. a30]|uniref:outer membrane lipoprotein-sorting protein n=1 Tax=Alteromonas sp. a30 TaxID=2730917 RepID=UPI00227F0163|nr:outer membrane lipoprotein-sorting protein [Alteromonas sp. a30]MCY7297175.1 outer membrane lipoprotein-sorting protein [Alteromonas sp. a30]